ncbi:component of the polarisome [Vanrija albida]|uniref:Component of the polarisome n=1 Tax=Vanrija albida TaxID=181172 RepID=A0ABR3PXC0_9TREE
MATRFGAAVPQAGAPAHNFPGYMASPGSNAVPLPGQGGASGTPRPAYMRLPSAGSSPNLHAMGNQPGAPMSAGTNQAMLQQRTGPAGAQGSLRKKDTKETAWVHWRALKDFLAAWAEKESPTARASAREKLTRLTRLQFLELSTDVYDELMRRLSVENGNPDGQMVLPFLPVRDDFHPKRNQARQKLATLPKNRFKDLASDVFFELRRRYPEFEEDGGQSVTHEKAPYDEPPAPGPVPLQQGHRTNPSGGSLRNVSNDNTQRQGHHRAGSSIGSSVSGGGPPLGANGVDRDRLANLTAATNDIVVPNKSRLHEEEIQVPYARDSQADVDMMGGRGLVGVGPSGLRERSDESFESGQIDSSATSPPRERLMSPTTDESQSQYLDRMSFASNVTSARGPKGAGITSPNGWDDHEQKLRADYELRIAGLERRLQIAETERDEVNRDLGDERERRRDFEDEVRGLKERATTHASSLRSIQNELDIARDSANTVRSQGDQTTRQAQEEISQWRERCEGLEDELRRLEEEHAHRTTTDVRTSPGGGAGGADSALVAELQAEMRSLVQELQEQSERYDKLVTELEHEQETRENLETRLAEYKKQFNAIRIEMRNLKATSTMFVSQPLTNDHLPASPDGNIADAHVSAFQTAIDGMLAAARSSHPSGVLPAMKAVVEAVTNVGEDVKKFEESPNLDVDVSRLESLKYESTSRLSGLMTAARNHAMASGLSPVSLIDAAAGHLSANVVEIIKLLKIRRTGSMREILATRGSMSIGDMVKRSNSVYSNPTPENGDSEDDDTQPLVKRPAGSEEELRDAHVTAGRDDRQNSGPYRGAGNYPAPAATMSPPRANLAAAPPPSSYDPSFRINSFQSVISTAQRSDSFDLERKGSTASVASASEYSSAPPRRLVEPRNDPFTGPPASQRNGPPVPVPAISTTSPKTHTSALQDSIGSSKASDYEKHMRGLSLASAGSSLGGLPSAGVHTTTFDQAFGRYEQNGSNADSREWDDLKPYLNTQSSALVNAIQNLLAAIRTGGQGPALNEHLSEVIAISSSIVGVSSSALPNHLRPQGDPLLADLVANTDRLGEAQQSAAHAGGFDKQLRQGIASASFGVAKALKSLMKLGGTE